MEREGRKPGKGGKKPPEPELEPFNEAEQMLNDVKEDAARKRTATKTT